MRITFEILLALASYFIGARIGYLAGLTDAWRKRNK
jgi:hypothetical protein